MSKKNDFNPFQADLLAVFVLMVTIIAFMFWITVTSAGH